MITGDYPATALEIARQAGIDVSADVLTGKEVAELDPDELRRTGAADPGLRAHHAGAEARAWSRR